MISESVMERMRDIVLFVSGAIAMVSVILALYEGFNQRLGSAAFLGGLFVACTFIVFLPKLEVFKAWGVEARLTKTLDRADEILTKLRRLSLISAKASYMNAAWSKRWGAPSTKERQALLDDVDQQLRDLNVSKAERDTIVEPLVQMIAADFYYAFANVTRRYAVLKHSALYSRANASQKREDSDGLAELNTRIGAWRGRLGINILDADPIAVISQDRLKTFSLKNELDHEIPDQTEWMSSSEREIAEKFRDTVLDLFEGCKKKGGYTAEAAAFSDQFPDVHKVVMQLFGDELKKME